MSQQSHHSKSCIDCPEEIKRAAPHPGPRCFTHWKVETKRRKQVAHERHVATTYNLPPGHYDLLYQWQGGRCYICQRATGKTKALAVDHNHETGEVRGLLCSPCNRGVLGHLREDVASLVRAIAYLHSSPYERMKNGEKYTWK